MFVVKARRLTTRRMVYLGAGDFIGERGQFNCRMVTCNAGEICLPDIHSWTQCWLNQTYFSIMGHQWWVIMAMVNQCQHEVAEVPKVFQGQLGAAVPLCEQQIRNLWRHRSLDAHKANPPHRGGRIQNRSTNPPQIHHPPKAIQEQEAYGSIWKHMEACNIMQYLNQVENESPQHEAKNGDTHRTQRDSIGFTCTNRQNQKQERRKGRKFSVLKQRAPEGAVQDLQSPAAGSNKIVSSSSQSNKNSCRKNHTSHLKRSQSRRNVDTMQHITDQSGRLSNTKSIKMANSQAKTTQRGSEKPPCIRDAHRLTSPSSIKIFCPFLLCSPEPSSNIGWWNLHITQRPPMTHQTSRLGSGWTDTPHAVQWVTDMCPSMSTSWGCTG